MAKTIPSQRSVYIAAAIVIVVTALWAGVFVPRLDMHPEAIKDGAADSSRMFFKYLLAAAVVLLVCVILSQLGGRIISGVITGLLYLAAGLVLFHDFMVFNGAVYYLDEYEGFSAEAILMLVCVGANLIAAILAIKAGNKYRQLALPRDW
jgi:choline-glycine betaine transporter